MKEEGGSVGLGEWALGRGGWGWSTRIDWYIEVHSDGRRKYRKVVEKTQLNKGKEAVVY